MNSTGFKRECTIFANLMDTEMGERSHQGDNPTDTLDTDSVSPLLATSLAPADSNKAIDRSLNRGLKYVNYLIRAPSVVRYGLSFGLRSSAVVLKNSKSVDSSQDLAVASAASAEATRHLALILSHTPYESG